MATTYKNLNAHEVRNEKRESVIWFIRHGESEANIGLATSYTEEVRLTDTGRSQSSTIAKTFTRAPDLIVSSPYKRSRETAAPTRSRFFSTKFEEWENVREFTYLGSLHGINSTKQERNAMTQAFWDKCDPFYQDGDGESFELFLRRVRDVMVDLKRCQEQFIIVFTHEQFIKGIEYLDREGFPQTLEDMQQSMQRFRQLLSSSRVPNGNVYRWSLA
jgi:2,3-bisphosphoglycerate-dependent phosphoglycerate mutase